MELKANILRIERLSLSDGKGMRTVVFFKGCPLRCAWCSTPESQSGAAGSLLYERALHRMRRLHPGLSEQALRRSEKNGRDREDHSRCKQCFQCVDACNYRAQQIYGKEMTVKRSNARDPEG